MGSDAASATNRPCSRSFWSTTHDGTLGKMQNGQLSSRQLLAIQLSLGILSSWPAYNIQCWGCCRLRPAMRTWAATSVTSCVGCPCPASIPLWPLASTAATQARKRLLLPMLHELLTARYSSGSCLHACYRDARYGKPLQICDRHWCICAYRTL